MACCGTIEKKDRSLRGLIQTGLRGGLISFALNRPPGRAVLLHHSFLRIIGSVLGTRPADAQDVPLLANRLLRCKISARLYPLSPRLAGLTFKGIKLLAPSGILLADTVMERFF